MVTLAEFTEFVLATAPRVFGGEGSMNECSEAARAKQNRSAQRERVYNAIVASPDGTTVDELAAKWGVPRHTIAPRFTELLIAGRITRRGKRETPTGCQAYVHFAA